MNSTLIMRAIDTINPSISVINAVALAMECDSFDSVHQRYGLSQALDMAVDQINQAVGAIEQAWKEDASTVKNQK